jgi:hypothetical protein
MALRSFRGAASNSTVVFTGQAFNRELLDTGAANGSNGSSVVLTAGQSRSFYLTSATGIPNLAVGVTGSWEAAINFQGFAPSNIFCKFRVHRISVSGTTPTILASTEYSSEFQAKLANTAYIFNSDGTDLGTFASGNRIAVEWTIRNAGVASTTPQPAFGTYAAFVRTPIEANAAVGWTGTLGRAAYRPISYSQGTINGVKRTGFVRNSITSTGTATGTQGGSDFSGSVTGVSTSSGTIAAGLQGYGGTIAGLSNSSGTIAAGLQGYAGSSAGLSTSSGSATGTQGGDPEPIFPLDWLEYQPPKDKKKGIEARVGKTLPERMRSLGVARGVQGFNGQAAGALTLHTKIMGLRAASGRVSGANVLTAPKPLTGRAAFRVHADSDLLVLMGEL